MRIDPAYVLKTSGIREDRGKLASAVAAAKRPEIEEARWWWD